CILQAQEKDPLQTAILPGGHRGLSQKSLRIRKVGSRSAMGTVLQPGKQFLQNRSALTKKSA
ncbi:MAG: hypothetical protein AMK70_10565, partial [Nitrospira bacterium SG8_35_1]